MRLPEFLVIGAMKAGTTTLFHDLRSNPRIFMPSEKEPRSLTRDDALTDAGRERYAQFFAQAHPDQVCGEASTEYAKRPDVTGVPERALSVLGPALKIIYIVREPVARIVSQHFHEYSEGAMGRDIDRAVREHPQLLDYSRYHMQIAPWRETLGSERVLILVFEEFVRDRRAAAESICAFLGVPAAPEEIRTEKVFNRGEGKPIARGPVARLIRGGLYRQIVRPLVPLAARDAIRRRLFPSAPERPAAPTPETIAWIRAELRDDLDRFSALLPGGVLPWPTDGAARPERG